MYDLRLTESLVSPQKDDAIRETTIGGILRNAAGKHGSREALVEVTEAGEIARRWTYQELLTDSERLALALSTRYKPGERVAVWAPNIPEWLLMEYACALAGLTLVTANPSFQARELRYVLEQSGSAGLFLARNYRGNPMSEIARTACKGLNGIREVIDLEDNAALFQIGDVHPTMPVVRPEDEAQILYTSGTTGSPKGAILHHRGLTNNARLVMRRARIPIGSTWLNFMPLFHTSGSGLAALGVLQIGGRLLLAKLFEPAAALRLMESEGAVVFGGVPTMMIAMLEILDRESHDLSEVRIAISGGSMVSPELVRRVRNTVGCGFQTVYGQTECSPVVTQHHYGDSLDDICNSVGQPLPCTGVSIRSVSTNEIVPVDEVGEICVRGYCTMIGYNGDVSATDATIDSDGWLHTGDLGAMDVRGYVRVTGRVKEMIIRGGENLFPAEIENVLLEHASVAEVAVVGLPDEKWGEIVAAFVRSNSGHAIDPGSLRRHCRDNISPQKTPEIWIEVAAFPLTGSGKIRRFELRDRFLAGEYAPIGAETPAP